MRRSCTMCTIHLHQKAIYAAMCDESEDRGRPKSRRKFTVCVNLKSLLFENSSAWKLITTWPMMQWDCFEEQESR